MEWTWNELPLSCSLQISQATTTAEGRFYIDYSFHWVWPSPTGGGKLTVFIKLPIHGEEHGCIMHYCIRFAVYLTKGLAITAFLLSMSPWTHHTHQQLVCVLSHHWCHINSYLMQLSSLFPMKFIIFAILLCHICSDTHSDRQGRYSRCLQMIAKNTSLKDLWFVCLLLKSPP